MLHIVITPPLLTKYEITRDSSKINNPEWLRAQDRKDATLYVSPFYDEGYFRQVIISPFLNADGYLDEEMLGVEWCRDGISYIITSLYGPVEYQKALNKLWEKMSIRYNGEEETS